MTVDRANATAVRGLDQYPVSLENQANPRGRRQVCMIFQELIGEKASEESFFQRLLFDVEANYEQYASKYMQLILEKHSDGEFEAVELIKFANKESLEINVKKLLKKKCWIKISLLRSESAVYLSLCRKDLTTKSAVIFKKGHTQISNGGYADPDAPPIELTDEEIIQGIRELCGIMEDHIESKSKKAV